METKSPVQIQKKNRHAPKPQLAQYQYNSGSQPGGIPPRRNLESSLGGI